LSIVAFSLLAEFHEKEKLKIENEMIWGGVWGGREVSSIVRSEKKNSQIFIFSF
jgi:hypothetical protein